MSYDIQLFRIETKERERQQKDGHFFDHEENLVPFTEQQFSDLRKRLLIYDYKLLQEGKHGLEYRNEEYGIQALLTRRGLYFTASWNKEAIFEAGMTASEFTDTDEFAKYDPQSDGWEEI